ncbi:MAG TPA: hypothetical protein VNI52_05225 [Sphingobacteriaceae bacterium]|nr:hypothetical protein [Sphingobacteriaceae bacterium]
MAKSLYNPFHKFEFSPDTCFLSGSRLNSSEEVMHVFSTWMMMQFNLEERPFKLLDESIITYKSLCVPCASEVIDQVIDPLEKEIENAFKSGYHAVKELDKLRLFQWIGKIVYGILYNEIKTGIKQQLAIGEPFNFSQSLRHKFGNLHTMLQSLILPVEFDGPQPWSIHVFHVNNAVDTFTYRDEINTQIFSIKLNDFGIIACLQDNGTNTIYHKNILVKAANHKLHPIQFEELCARFFYSAYLFNRLPEYTILPTPDALYIEAMPLRGISNKPPFDLWQNKTYGQVLENFWKPWGYSLLEIVKNPEKPMSFLIDDQDLFILPQNIDLPLGSELPG